MTPPAETLFELKERSRFEVAESAVPYEVGELLWTKYRDQVDIEFPSPKTGRNWWFTPRDWVGYIPLDRERGIALSPKVPVGNIFRMLEYAYRFKFLLPGELTTVGSLSEFYERLAMVLAQQVLGRARRGLYRSYLPMEDDLPYVRGNLDMNRRLRKPWQVRLPCGYQEHTADVPDNQILLWTLYRVAHSGACSERVLPTVRRAYRAVIGLSDLVPHLAADCTGRQYNRLNDDYHPMHALCRFFLDQSGPIHDKGDRTMLPFLVDMSKLFEMFAFEWLKAHMPAYFLLQAQKHVPVGQGDVMTMDIDMVLKDTTTGKTLCVMDTKYKQPDKPSNADVYQIISYAVAEGCKRAYLVYPAPLKRPLDEMVDDIHVKTLTFGIDGDLEKAGAVLLNAITECQVS